MEVSDKKSQVCLLMENSMMFHQLLVNMMKHFSDLIINFLKDRFLWI